MSDKAVIDSVTGEWLRGPYCEADFLIPGSNETIIDVDARYPECPWSPTTRTFVEPPISVTNFEYLQLFTASERAAARASANPLMQDAIMLTYASPTINLGNEAVLQGIALMQSLAILTPERAARVAAAQLPEDPS